MNKDKIIYIVTADTYQDSYGAEISLFLVTDQKQKADEKLVELNAKGYYPKIRTVNLDEDTDIYLGGYIE